MFPRNVVLNTVTALALLACTLHGHAARAQASAPAQPSAASEVRFTVRVPGSGGQVICALFRENGWLKRPVSTVKAAPRAHHATCVFSGLGLGPYGIVAFHDENDNGSIDKNFLGLPTEDWCTSRNAKATFGPPSFNDAKFSARPGVVRLSGSM